MRCSVTVNTYLEEHGEYVSDVKLYPQFPTKCPSSLSLV